MTTYYAAVYLQLRNGSSEHWPLTRWVEIGARVTAAAGNIHSNFVFMPFHFLFSS